MMPDQRFVSPGLLPREVASLFPPPDFVDWPLPGLLPPELLLPPPPGFDLSSCAISASSARALDERDGEL
jgi:hypothetical protein